METVPKPKTEIFPQNCGEPKPRFFGAKWIRFHLLTFVFIYGDLLNAIIYSAGHRCLWITGIGVCSNSIESATQTNRKFALA